MPDVAIVFVVIALLASATLGSIVLSEKGRGAELGFLLGLLLGLFGVAIALSMSPSMDRQVERWRAIEREIRKREEEGDCEGQESDGRDVPPSTYAEKQEVLRRRYEEQRRRRS